MLRMAPMPFNFENAQGWLLLMFYLIEQPWFAQRQGCLILARLWLFTTELFDVVSATEYLQMSWKLWIALLFLAVLTLVCSLALVCFGFCAWTTSGVNLSLLHFIGNNGKTVLGPPSTFKSFRLLLQLSSHVFFPDFLYPFTWYHTSFYVIW